MAAAPALATARETPRIALAPSLAVFQKELKKKSSCQALLCWSTLVLGAIELEQELVHISLLGDVKVLLDEGGGDNGVDVVDGGENTLAEVLGLVVVAELKGLVNASRGTGRDGGTEQT